MKRIFLQMLEQTMFQSDENKVVLELVVKISKKLMVVLEERRQYPTLELLPRKNWKHQICLQLLNPC